MQDTDKASTLYDSNMRLSTGLTITGGVYNFLTFLKSDNLLRVAHFRNGKERKESARIAEFMIPNYDFWSVHYLERLNLHFRD
jgi:Fe2+ or Zn2+ uptake regulation protein